MNTTTESRKPGRPITTGVTIVETGHDTPCWIWNGTTTKAGYGLITRKDFTGCAHRFYFEKEHGPIPEGLQLDHAKCQIRACCNPAHLEIVTPAENVRRSRSAKLNENKVKAMRSLYAQGSYPQRELAKIFGVCQALVSYAVNGHIWRGIDNNA